MLSMSVLDIHCSRCLSKNNRSLRIKSEDLKYIFSYRNGSQKDSRKNIYKYIQNKIKY